MTINFAGKERVLKFNIFGIERMQDKNEDRSTMASLYAMLWGGLEGARYASEQDKDYNFSDLIDFVDNMENEDRNKLSLDITALLMESQAYKKLVPEQQPEEEKKSQQPSIDTTT